MSDASKPFEDADGVRTHVPPPEADDDNVVDFVTAEEAIERLAAAVDAAETDATSQDRKRRFTELTAEKSWVHAFGQAYCRLFKEVEPLLLRLDAMTGMRDIAASLRRIGREAKKEWKQQAQLGDLSGLDPNAPPPDMPLDLVLEDCLGDHEIPDGLLAPRGYLVSDAGIVLHVPSGDEIKKVPISAVPILITGRLTDIDTRDVHLHIEWLWRGTWRSLIAPRRTLFESRAIVALSDKDFPVGSDNAREVVRYLHAFDDKNARLLPTARVSSHMGWQGRHGKDGFLFGRTLILGGDANIKVVQVDIDPPSTWTDAGVALHAEDGVAQLVEGYRTEGTWEGWLEAWETMRRYPAVVLAVLASCTSVMLMVVEEAPNLVKEWVGRTSQGKTTALRAGCSVWGFPDERGGGVMLTWDSTRVFIERATAALGGLPPCIDDTMRAKDKKMVGQVIYDHVSGRGRGRGTVTGLAISGTHRSVMLSTGEVPSTALMPTGGNFARVISLRKDPFGGPAAADVERIKAGVFANYGHLGQRLVRWLLDNRDLWPGMVESYRTHRARWMEQVGDDPVAVRATEYLAMLSLTQQVLLGFVGLPQPVGNPVELALEAVRQGAAGADRPRAALEFAYGWACRHTVHFWGRHEADEDGNLHPPFKGWAGAWSPSPGWPYIAFEAGAFNDVMKEGGFEPQAVLDAWDQEGWLDKDAGHRTKKVVVHGGRPRCVVISRKAVDDVC